MGKEKKQHMETPNAIQFDEETLKALQDRFDASGKDIDTFLRDELKASGRQDADQVADDIIGTMGRIDENYAEVQKARADGYSRKDWLNRKFNAIFYALSPKVAGEYISRLIGTLKGEPTETPPESEFVGREAREMIASLDDALEQSAMAELALDPESPHTTEGC